MPHDSVCESASCLAWARLASMDVSRMAVTEDTIKKKRDKESFMMLMKSNPMIVVKAKSFVLVYIPCVAFVWTSFFWRPAWLEKRTWAIVKNLAVQRSDSWMQWATIELHPTVVHILLPRRRVAKKFV